MFLIWTRETCAGLLTGFEPATSIPDVSWQLQQPYCDVGHEVNERSGSTNRQFTEYETHK
jgi:hypothetical protein